MNKETQITPHVAKCHRAAGLAASVLSDEAPAPVKRASDGSKFDLLRSIQDRWWEHVSRQTPVFLSQDIKSLQTSSFNNCAIGSTLGELAELCQAIGEVGCLD